MLSRSNVYGAAVLIQRLQEIAPTPLLVSADLEAGLGMRFDDTTYGPWAMAIAATGDPSLAERRGRATAEEARAIGVAQVFAPVADVNVNPDNPVINVRSFGEDPADVARYVAATVRGLQAGQVLATLKHFPGHGDTASDSHRSLATVPGDRARLESVELPPFRAGIAAGAESVMIAHVSVPALDATPVTLARERAEAGRRDRRGRRGPERRRPRDAFARHRDGRPAKGARLHGARRDGRDAHGRHHVLLRARRGRRARPPRGRRPDPPLERHRRGDQGRHCRNEVGPDHGEAARRERHAHPRRQEAPRPLRQGHPVRRRRSRRSSGRGRTRSSRRRSRAAR